MDQAAAASHHIWLHGQAVTGRTTAQIGRGTILHPVAWNLWDSMHNLEYTCLNHHWIVRHKNVLLALLPQDGSTRVLKICLEAGGCALRAQWRSCIKAPKRGKMTLHGAARIGPLLVVQRLAIPPI